MLILKGRNFFLLVFVSIGFGGGFKENSKIEYNERRDDSDGEYDEVINLTESKL